MGKQRKKEIKMKNKKLLLSALLLSGAIVFSAATSAFAADQRIQATMAPYKIVRGTGTNLTAGVITPDPATNYSTANLTGNISPGFQIVDSDAGTGHNLSLTANCPGTVANNAIFQFTGTQSATDYTNNFGGYIAMSKQFATATAVNNVVTGAALPDNNNDVIAFPINTFVIQNPSGESGSAYKIQYTSNANGLTATTKMNGATQLDFKVAGASATNTFSYGDSSGDYEATITMTFTS
jgi:hypothetical protein